DRLLPPEVELVHGPGCPVCVTSLEMIDRAQAIASPWPATRPGRWAWPITWGGTSGPEPGCPWSTCPAARSSRTGRLIRNLRVTTNATVNKEPKWRHRGRPLTTGQLRYPRTVRGRRPVHPDLRGERAGQVQGDRHHAGGPQLRPVSAVWRPHA